MISTVKNRKGVKVTLLASKSKRVSKNARRERVFQIDGMPGYFTGGTINGEKINIIYSVEHPSIESGLDRVRFQVYDNADKSKIVAKNFEKVSALALEYFGVKVYCYNEIAKKNSKQASPSVSTAACTLTKQSRCGFRSLFKVLFERLRERRAV